MSMPSIPWQCCPLLSPAVPAGSSEGDCAALPVLCRAQPASHSPWDPCQSSWAAEPLQSPGLQGSRDAHQGRIALPWPLDSGEVCPGEHHTAAEEDFKCIGRSGQILSILPRLFLMSLDWFLSWKQLPFPEWHNSVPW